MSIGKGFAFIALAIMTVRMDEVSLKSESSSQDEKAYLELSTCRISTDDKQSSLRPKPSAILDKTRCIDTYYQDCKL
jgi:hypothetical protein